MALKRYYWNKTAMADVPTRGKKAAYILASDLDELFAEAREKLKDELYNWRQDIITERECNIDFQAYRILAALDLGGTA